MARAAHILSLKTWLELALGFTPPDPRVIFLAARASSSPGAGAPRPPKPYVSFRVTGETGAEGPDQVSETTNTLVAGGPQYEHNIFVFKEGRVAVTVYGDDHDELMQSIVDSIKRPSIQVHFDNAGVLVTRSGGTAASYGLEAISTRLEDRSERVFLWRRTRVTSDAVDVIDSAVVTPKP